MINSRLLASNYLRSFPSYLQTIDLFSYAQTNPSDFWALLQLNNPVISPSFSFEITTEQSATFSHFFSEYRKDLKNTGLSSLAIGYPLVYHQVEEDWILAPLFLWSVRIKWDPQSAIPWTLHRKSYDPVQLNPAITECSDSLFVEPFTPEEKAVLNQFKLDYSQFQAVWNILVGRFF